MLEVININVFYGNVQVLWDVSFEVNEKEITTIVGANGAGKTTILKTISGLIHPTSGHIKFLGKKIDGLSPHQIVRLGIVQCRERMGIFPYMTVLENLELASYLKEAKQKRKETLDWVFQLFPILKERRKQKAGTLSGGEQKMLTLAMALMAKPKLLLLDEPSLGLAPKLVLEVFKIIRELNDQGLTILLVEQNVQHALQLSRKAYVLETGRITLEGKSEELLKDERVKKAYLGL